MNVFINSNNIGNWKIYFVLMKTGLKHNTYNNCTIKWLYS